MNLASRIGLLSCLTVCAVVFFAETWWVGDSRAEPSNENVRDVTVMPAKHVALLHKYCFQCHDSKQQEGGIDLQTLSSDLGTIESAEIWSKVLGAINSGEMPPDDENQLAAAEKADFLDELSHRLVAARKLLSDQGGVIAMRRLNRREYTNTIRDLLGVNVDARDLPDDSNSGGFDTSGSALFISSDQFEKYLRIAVDSLDAVMATRHAPAVVAKRRESEEEANRQTKNRLSKLTSQYEKAQAWRASDQPPTDFGFIDADRVKFEEGLYRNQAPAYQSYLAMPETKTGVVLITSFAGAFLDITQIPDKAPPGDYVIRARVGAFADASAHDRFLELGEVAKGARSGELNVLACRKVTGTIEDPQILEIPIKLTSHSNRSFGLRQRQQNNRDAARAKYRQAIADGLSMPAPALWVDWVEIQGPLRTDSAVTPYRSIFFRGEDAEETDQYAREIITKFARRAFRTKEPTAAYVDRLMQLYTDRREEGESFQEGVKEALSVVLASPSFLYLREPSDAQSKRELTDLELAVRLSYFLWSAPPDETLLELAQRGELSDPQVLAAQTDRMLDSERLLQFVSGFTSQWLGMERLDFFQFDPNKYSDFDDSVKIAARAEVLHTVDVLLKENLPIGRLIESDFVVINDLLADYYGIEDVQGEQFRKVALPTDSPRGGLLGTAAVLAMGSDGERSSPVERGAWVMRKILNDPPPPAPANVPQLSRLAGTPLSARELQKAHQEEPQCAQCHRKIDPIGFGLENFDAAGRWRAVEPIELAFTGEDVKKKFGKSDEIYRSIDPSGTLPDGTEFAGFDELRTKLHERQADFARGFTEAMIAYGLGRAYGFTDEPLATQIMNEAQSNDFAMRSFIHAFVQSESFQTK